MITAHSAIYPCETPLIPELPCEPFRLVKDLKGTFRIPYEKHWQHYRKANTELLPRGFLALRMSIQHLDGLLVEPDSLPVGIAPCSLVPGEFEVITGLPEVL